MTPQEDKEYSKDRRLRRSYCLTGDLLGRVTERQVACEPELRFLAAKSAHRVAGVASFILLADVRDQHLRSLHLNFESGDQRVFCVNDDVPCFSLKFKANRKLHPAPCFC